MNYVILIPANATMPISAVAVDGGNLLHELQWLVGGYIELAPYVRGRLGLRNHELIVNDNGKNLGFPPNFRATRYNYGRNVSDILAGDAVVVRSVPDDIAGWDNADSALTLVADIKRAVSRSEVMTQWTTQY